MFLTISVEDTKTIFCYDFEAPLSISETPIQRSRRPKVFCKKGVLRKFTKFTGKHLCQSLFFNNVAGLRTATLLKKRLWHRCFPVDFVKFLRTPFYIEHLWWLLLYSTKSSRMSSSNREKK